MCLPNQTLLFLSGGRPFLKTCEAQLHKQGQGSQKPRSGGQKKTGSPSLFTNFKVKFMKFHWSRMCINYLGWGPVDLRSPMISKNEDLILLAAEVLRLFIFIFIVIILIIIIIIIILILIVVVVVMLILILTSRSCLSSSSL